ncbi:unnamed protein product [Ambrosiozyma monospora]|uniref:Unnamed protein product n=1 Tax=Ambrosiozyma monospora TaxID=43982 RepID=A0ACB5TCL8_AMBMO|nr:unnamed protein product [Ambrosiozyma monospora]
MTDTPPPGTSNNTLSTPSTGHKRQYSDSNPFKNRANAGPGNESDAVMYRSPASSQSPQLQQVQMTGNSTGSIDSAVSPPVNQMAPLSIACRPPVPVPQQTTGQMPYTPLSNERIQQLAERPPPPLPPLPPREARSRSSFHLHNPNYGSAVGSSSSLPSNQISVQSPASPVAPAIQIIPPTSNTSPNLIDLDTTPSSSTTNVTSGAADGAENSGATSTGTASEATQTTNNTATNSIPPRVSGNTGSSLNTDLLGDSNAASTDNVSIISDTPTTTTTSNATNTTRAGEDDDFFRHGDNTIHSDENTNDNQSSSQSLTSPIPGNRLLTPEEMRQEEEEFINAMPPSPNYSSEALPGELSIPHHMAIDPVTLNELVEQQ